MEVLKDFRANVRMMVLPGFAGMMTAKVKVIAYYLTGKTFKGDEVPALPRNCLYITMIVGESRILRRHGFRS